MNGRTLTRSALLRIPRSQLQRLMRSEGDIANLIMQATVWRRLGIIERSAAGIVLLGRQRRSRNDSAAALPHPQQLPSPSA